ncbi:MAG: rhomboid family protein [Lentisphaeria bacterium]|nr:rhomboid family protein [Lentisphaeria bacterium]
MPQILTNVRCCNHALREAVAKCPECEEFYCRECVTEHEGRVLCSTCLREQVDVPEQRWSTRGLLGLARPILSLAAFLIIWLFFQLFGQILLTIPSSFHEGTFWEQFPWQ